MWAIAATFLTAMFQGVSTEFRVITWLVLFGLIAAMMRGAFRRELRDRIEQVLERRLHDRDQ
jgi:hypothetical protein